MQPALQSAITQRLSAFAVTQIANAGRGLVAAKAVDAGEVVLQERPLVLTVSASMVEAVCANCLRFVKGGQHIACDCKQAVFCDQHCQQAAASYSGRHTQRICRIMAAAELDKLHMELADQARFVIQALCLHGSLGGKTAQSPQDQRQCAEQRQAILKLQSAEDADLQQHVAWALQHLPNVPLELVKGLAGREQINAYGIMAPSGAEGERRIRGSGLFNQASLLNHDCMPNVARYDDFDAATGDNTVIQFRALHHIPAGEQLTQSYFPLTWSYEERQQRCQQQYGFTCACSRCKVESTWLDEAQIEGSNSEGDELADNQTHACCNSKPCQHNSGAEHAEGSPAKKRKVEPPLVSDDIPKGQKSSCTHGKAPFATQDSNAQNAVTDDEGVDEAYIMAYLDRHVCDQEFSIGSDNNAMICGGTMAPCGVNSDEYECNMCGYTRSEAERIAKLERMYLEVTADVP